MRLTSSSLYESLEIIDGDTLSAVCHRLPGWSVDDRHHAYCGADGDENMLATVAKLSVMALLLLPGWCRSSDGQLTKKN